MAEASAVVLPTPFGMRVVLPRSELSAGRTKTRKWPGQFPLDREVIEYLDDHVDANDTGKRPHE